MTVTDRDNGPRDTESSWLAWQAGQQENHKNPRPLLQGSWLAFAGGVTASAVAAWLGNDRSAYYSVDTCAPTSGNTSLYWQVWICVAAALVLAVAGFVLLSFTHPSNLALVIGTVIVVLTLILSAAGLVIGSSVLCPLLPSPD